MLKTLENYQDEAAAAFYVDRAVVRIKAAVKSPRFQTAYLEAQRNGNNQVNFLMLGFLDVEEIQARWNDERLGEILLAATYIHHAASAPNFGNFDNLEEVLEETSCSASSSL